MGLVHNDDIDGSVGDVKTHTFSLNGRRYKIDLGPANTDLLTKALEEFVLVAEEIVDDDTDAPDEIQVAVESAAPAAKPAGTVKAAAGLPATNKGLNPERRAAVNAWLKEKGVPKRFRSTFVTAQQIADYNAAHAG